MEDDTPNEVVSIRDEKGRIKKGFSLNAAGGNRPKIFRDLAGNKKDIDEMFRDGAPFVAQELLKVIRDPKTPHGAKVSACKAWLERAYGKPAITLSSPETAEESSYDWDGLSTDTLGKVIALIQPQKDK